MNKPTFYTPVTSFLSDILIEVDFFNIVYKRRGNGGGAIFLLFETTYKFNILCYLKVQGVGNPACLLIRTSKIFIVDAKSSVFRIAKLNVVHLTSDVEFL